MKRILDVLLSFIALLILFPILVIILILIFVQDGYNPFFISSRVGKRGVLFKMVKIRTMVKDADVTGVSSTSDDDNRITRIGHFVRRYKLDELPQLWNVLIGEMTIIGPRPNVKAGTDLYTEADMRLLTVKPGLSDFSSIVFSDEGDILKGKADPDISYNELIRPWKSRLGIVYIENQNFLLDIKIIMWTLLAMFCRKKALIRINQELKKLSTDSDLIDICKRDKELVPLSTPELIK